ncbi:hypothetical protein LWI29_010945 [Acer saccharum]|uniref:Uncharacterized protein n=1 Tax=Acer saccharum TaxID=4024 RepID=A0AA39VX02_ACESA|nr:hypothetical protein LWI29_010945 [Acer saccharum]
MRKKRHLQETQIIIHGFEQNDYVAPRIITTCALPKKIARKVFDRIPDPNTSSWNAVFKGYAQSEFHREEVVLFRRTKKLDVSPNCFTFPILLKSCWKICTKVTKCIVL